MIMKKILIVDDDPAILEVIKIILEDSEYDVVTSENGNFINSISKTNPDLVLLDVLLSGEDGREIVKKLRKNSATQQLPVVMMSAHPNANKSAFAAGANDFVSKPFDIDDLLQVIERNLNKN